MAKRCAGLCPPFFAALPYGDLLRRVGGAGRGAPVIDFDGQSRPPGQPDQLSGAQAACRAQAVVRKEVNGCPRAAVTSDLCQRGNRDAMLVTLAPGSLAAAAGVDEPLA